LDTNRDIVDRLISGAIDFHVHTGPDPVQRRRVDALELARQAMSAGMRAAVIKSHHFGTAPLADAVNQVVPGFTLVGSLTLNSAVGGLNPEAVEAAIRLGARVIWMPTYSSMGDTRLKAASLAALTHSAKSLTRRGISVLDDEGRLLPETLAILDIIKGGSVVLATGHLPVAEAYALVAATRPRGVKVTVTHPLAGHCGARFTLTQQIELADMGAFMEHAFLDCMPPPYAGLPVSVLAEHIRAVGAGRCVMATDLGQPQNPTPIEGFRAMLAALLKAGLSEAELATMVKTNPARLLNLD
jgi:hypothetical protein